MEISSRLNIEDVRSVLSFLNSKSNHMQQSYEVRANLFKLLNPAFRLNLTAHNLSYRFPRVNFKNAATRSHVKFIGIVMRMTLFRLELQTMTDWSILVLLTAFI